jgi:uncharacterized protein (TIGR03032 family)
MASPFHHRCRETRVPSNENENAGFELTCSHQFPQWLADMGVSISFTTYQAGKVFLLGLKPDGRLSVFERTFPRGMGIAVSADGRTLALATQFQIHRFDNLLPAGQASPEGYDAVYAPHAGWVTGDLDAHDVAFGDDGRPLFVNTLFSCVASVSESHSFKPVWKPPFISRLAAEDRCHLNGFALESGRLRYVTAVSRSDVADGWRDRRTDGGVIIDTETNEIIVQGLSMPHSPRLHAGRLWVLNSGAGDFGFVDLKSGQFDSVAFCPGYARGLTFIGDFAIVGLSLARDNRTFEGLPLDQALADRDTAARCGLVVFNLKSGDMVAWVRIEGVVRELYDVAVLPGTRRPSLIGFKSDEVRYVISIDE